MIYNRREWEQKRDTSHTTQKRIRTHTRCMIERGVPVTHTGPNRKDSLDRKMGSFIYVSQL